MKQKDFNLQFVKAVSSKASDFMEDLVSQIKDGPKLSALAALRVYQEDYQARLTEALRNTYRAIHALIGDEDFNILAKDYIQSTPSNSSDLDDYGNHLSAFLKNHSLINNYVFLSELAHFEWNFRETFHLEQSVGLGPQELMTAIQNENELIQLARSARILDYNFQITPLYALKNSEVDDESNDEPFDFKIPQSILMYKLGVQVKTQVLSKNQINFLKQMTVASTLKACFANASADLIPEEIQILFQILGTERLILKLTN